jgi:hypothetical protein
MIEPSGEHTSSQPGYKKDGLGAPLIPPEKKSLFEELVKSFEPQSGVSFRVAQVLHIFPPGRFKRENMGNMGGHDMTRRTIDDLAVYLPHIKELIEHEQGKIVILGNGLSAIPIDLAERFTSGQVSESPVIVDVVNYELLLEDLKRLREIFEAHGEDYPFADDLEVVAQIVEAKQNGSLRTESYMVGSGEAPESLLNAGLVINPQGPSLQTYQEQLSYLAENGILAISDTNSVMLNKIAEVADVIGFDENYTEGSGVLIRRK